MKGGAEEEERAAGFVISETFIVMNSHSVRWWALPNNHERSSDAETANLFQRLRLKVIFLYMADRSR